MTNTKTIMRANGPHDLIVEAIVRWEIILSIKGAIVSYGSPFREPRYSLTNFTVFTRLSLVMRTK